MKKPLTVEKLKGIFLARFKAEQRKEVKLQKQTNPRLGDDQAMDPVIIAINNKLCDWLSAVLAHRLKQNCRATPLVSSKDFARFIPLMLEAIENATGNKLEDEDRELFKKFRKHCSTKSSRDCTR